MSNPYLLHFELDFAFYDFLHQIISKKSIIKMKAPPHGDAFTHISLNYLSYSGIF